MNNEKRKNYLDNIRWITILIVVAFHVFYYYNNIGVTPMFAGLSDNTAVPGTPAAVTSLDALYNTEGLPDGTGVAPPPKGKHLFGVVTMNEKGQIVIPKKARDVMGYNSSEELVVLGDEGNGLALMRVCDFEKQMQDVLESIKK